MGDEGVERHRWIDDELALTGGGDEEDAVSCFQATPVAEEGGQPEMALAGDLEVTSGVRADHEQAGGFADIQTKPGRPAQGAHDGAVGKPATVVERSKPIDGRGCAPA